MTNKAFGLIKPSHSRSQGLHSRDETKTSPPISVIDSVLTDPVQVSKSFQREGFSAWVIVSTGVSQGTKLYPWLVFFPGVTHMSKSRALGDRLDKYVQTTCVTEIIWPTTLRVMLRTQPSSLNYRPAHTAWSYQCKEMVVDVTLKGSAQHAPFHIKLKMNETTH